ncbi:MAG: DUF4956 domain-containing protein [Clostridia bacterium]|nr:DUF4956 domain-containing protein [Clostridia bacterium]
MNLFSNIFLNGMSVATYLLSAGCAIFCGLLVAFVTKFRNRVTKSFFASLIVLPLAVQTVIVMVNGSVGTGIAVAGAFSLIRFRSVPAKARDIVSIFVTMTAGLSCAAGYVGIGVLFTFIACACILLLSFVKISTDREQELHITVPENLNFTGAFDEVLEKYTSKSTLVFVKSTNMGSLYKLTYRIEMKNEGEIRDFIDELRVRNGNLEISILKLEGSAEEL